MWHYAKLCSAKTSDEITYKKHKEILMKGLILALLPIFVACLQKKEEPRVDISAKGSKSHSLPTLPERTQFTYEDLIVPANRSEERRVGKECRL